MSKMKLSVELIDNHVQSAVINIGVNSGYIEAYLGETNLALYIFAKDGEVILEQYIPIKDLQNK